MKVVFSSSVLAPGGAEGVQSFTIDGQELVQIDDIVNSTAAKVTSRGNTRYTIRFEVERQHASALAAQDFVAVHHASLSKAGTLFLECQSNVDDTIKIVRFNNSALDRHSGRFVGSASFHTYVIQAGTFGGYL